MKSNTLSGEPLAARLTLSLTLSLSLALTLVLRLLPLTRVRARRRCEGALSRRTLRVFVSYFSNGHKRAVLF